MNNIDLNTKEQAFTEILQDMQFDVDTEGLWGEIESSIPVANNKRNMFWFIALGLLFTTSASTAYFFLSQEPVEQTSLIKQKHQETSNFVIASNIEDKAVIKSKTISNNTLNAANKKNSHKLNKQVTISNSLVNSNLRTNKSKLTVQSLIEPVRHQNNITSYRNTFLPINSLHHNTLLIPLVDNIETVKHESIQINKRFSLNSIAPLSVVTTIPLLDDHNTVSIFPELENINIVKSKLWKSFMVFSSGINLNNSDYLINSDIDNDDDLFDLEKGKLGMSSSFLYGKKNKSGWEWNIGLGHQMIVSQYNNHSEKINKETVETIVESYINKDGIVNSQSGKVDKSIVKQYDITWHRQHQLFDIKGGIGKEVVRYKNFGLTINTGLAYTLYSLNNGYYFENNKSDITKINNSKHPYKTSGLIKYYTGIGVAYNWNRYAFGMNANYMSDINSMTKNTNYYSLKNSQYGIQFSILYRPY